MRRRVGVVPPLAGDSRRRLLASLEEAFPVVFESRDLQNLDNLDGILVLGPTQLGNAPVGVPTLVTSSSVGSPSASAVIEFTSNEWIARPLRGRTLVEDAAHRSALMPSRRGDSVLATVDGEPVWWRRDETNSPLHVSTFVLEELQEADALRSHLRAGRFMGLVPLLHFLRDVCKELNWNEQPLQASFVIDDPNLHWPSYGFLRYVDLIRNAAVHGYHVGLAMVPIDGWLINRRAAALVRENGAFLSILVHGNEHVARELGRLSTDREAEFAVGQALRRVRRFERRSGVAVKRVMAPPHGACSEAALRAMLRFGFDAACITRPYPWRDGLPPPWPLAGWFPAELVGGGLPVLPRQPIAGPRDDLVFRALLRQPLILYGHHWDLAHGLETFELATEDVNRLGDVRWGPLDQIATTNYATRREGAALVVQMYSRRAVIDVPADVSVLRVQTTRMLSDPLWQKLSYGHCQTSITPSAVGWSSDLLDVAPSARLEVSFSTDRPLDPHKLPILPNKLWPIARRILVEGRDRMRPFASSLPRRPTRIAPGSYRQHRGAE